MDRMRLLKLTRNLHNFKIGYFLRYQHSSILKNNSGRAFCTFLQIENNGKTQQQFNFSSISPFLTFNNALLQKHGTKANFSTKNLSTRREHSDKFETLGIETIPYLLGRQRNVLAIRIRHNKKNGNKCIHLSRKNPFANSDYPNIPINDAYLLIRRIDSLLMNKFADHHKDNHPICEIFMKGRLYYDYRLEIFKAKKYDVLEFIIEAIEKKSKRRVPSKSFPIQVLPLLRDGMAKLLMEFDGTQQFGPPTLPKWVLEDVNIKTVDEDANNLQKQVSLFYRDSLNYKVDDEPWDRKIQIEYVQGASGTEFIETVQRFDKQMKLYNDDNDDKYQYLKFPNIPIEDISPLQNALQIMSNDLQKKPKIDQNQSSMICPQFIKGLLYDYKMEFYSCKNQQLDFRLKAIPNEANRLHKPTELLGPIPIYVFHWLKEQLVDILLLISTSSHKLGQPNDAAEKQGTDSDLFESKAARIEILHEEKLEYLDNENEKNIVLIQMKQSNNKKKWIFLITRLPFAEHKFAKIFVPDDAYSVVKAMDELMNKIVDLEKPPDFPIFVRVSGIRYDYGLGIRSNPNQNDQLIFTMESITTAVDPWHKPKPIYMSIRLFPLLRDIMAKMLVEFDGTKQIGQLPSPLPKWILQSEEDSNQQNVVKISEEAKQLETIRQEKLDFIVNTFSGNFDRQIIIELQRNKQGEEFIQIVQKFDKLESSNDIVEENKKIVFFPPIPIIDAYRLPDSMQALSNDLEEKYPGLRIPNDIPPKTSICRQIIKGGLLYDYKLAICICPLSNQLNFKLKTITTEANKSHTSEKLYGPTPLHVFNWLKEQIAELLKSSSNQQKQKTFQKEPLEFKKGKEDWNNLKNSLLISVNGIGQTAYKHLKMREGLIRRETEYYNVEGELHDRMMNIEFKQGKSGRKYIQIVQRFIEKDRALFINFPKIPLTEDIYRLLDAMRAMSNELEEKRPTLFIGENKPSTICQKLVKGFFYNYKMELHSLQNQQLDFRLKTIPNKASKGHKPEELVGPIPIDIFKWMMEQIVEILEDYYESDGNEK